MMHMEKMSAIMIKNKQIREEENMKKKRINKRITAAATAFCLVMGSGPYTLAAETEAVSADETKIEEPVLKKISGKYYCYQGEEKVTNSWVTLNGKEYYFGADGAAKTGWYTIKKGTTYKSYYFSSKGVLNPSKTKSIDKKYNSMFKKMDSIIKKNATSKSAKTNLLKLFRYVSKNYGYARALNFTGAEGWEYSYARSMFSTKKGSCYHFAAAYAFLAKRATGYPVRICWGKGKVFSSKWQYHAWCEIKIGGTWYTFDPNADKYSKLRIGKWYMQKKSSMKKVYRTEGYVNVEL